MFLQSDPCRKSLQGELLPEWQWGKSPTLADAFNRASWQAQIFLWLTGSSHKTKKCAWRGSFKKLALSLHFDL